MIGRAGMRRATTLNPAPTAVARAFWPEEILERGPEIRRQWTNRQLHAPIVSRLTRRGNGARTPYASGAASSFSCPLSRQIMKLIRERDVPIGNGDRVYRYSRARAVVAYGTIVAGFAALFVVGSRGHVLPLQIISVIGIFGLSLARRFLAARFRPSNWLVRQSENGLYLHFRSYLNYHFSPDDRTVAFIPYREI